MNGEIHDLADRPFKPPVPRVPSLQKKAATRWQPAAAFFALRIRAPAGSWTSAGPECDGRVNFGLLEWLQIRLALGNFCSRELISGYSGEGRGMGEVHQLASAMLVLAFAAATLVIGLLFIERSGRPFDLPIPAYGVLSLANEVGVLRSHT